MREKNYQFMVVCINSFYAGQGMSVEKGECKGPFYTKDEADAVLEVMTRVAWGDKSCWEIVTYQEYIDKHTDPEQGPKEAQKLKVIMDRRQSCKLPHNYSPISTVKHFSAWRCSECGDELDASCANWYMNGRRDERK